MNDDHALVKRLDASLQLGSLKELVRASETVMLLLDTSSSMLDVMRNGRSRIAALRDVVRDIRSAGDVPMIAFGGPFDAQVRFVDEVPEPLGGTPLAEAIAFAKQYGANRLVVISDGAPNLPDHAMSEAQAFGGRIDVVFVGNPGETGSLFLDALAKVTGGTRLEGDLADVKKLGGAVIGLLEGEVAPARGPIEGPGFTADEPDDAAGTDGDEDEDFEEDADDEDEE